MYGWILAGIMLATSIAAYKIQTARLHNAQESLQIAKTNQAQLTEALKRGNSALQQCQSVNESNAFLITQQKQRAEKAEQRVSVITSQADRELASIEAQANDNRETHSDSRRTLVDPLPADLVGWMPGYRTHQDAM